MSNIASLALALTVVWASSSDDTQKISTSAATEVESLKAHYAAAECELLARDSTSLTIEQRARRARLIEALHAYRERGVFGRDVDHPGARTPTFVDEDGRRCAVAELLHSTGEDELVERVHTNANTAWILDLSHDSEFRSWLERNGLTLEEAARIQAPAKHKFLIPSLRPGNDSFPMPPAPSKPTSPGSAGTAGSRGDASPSGQPGSGPGTNGPSSPGIPGGRTGFDPLSASTGHQDDVDTWATWWEYNKLEYLRPNQLSLWSFPATGDHAREGFESQLAAMRKSLVPLFSAALEHKDPRVRGAAAVSLGRIGGHEGVEDLKKLLADPNVDVRHHAILALGATGSSEAAALLLGIAEHGSVEPESRERISRQAPALAIVALGLLRQSCHDAGIDEAVGRIARMRRGDDKNLVEEAAFMYETLSPCAELEDFALEIAQHKNGDPSARCRAVECLRKTQNSDTLSKLQHILSGSRLDLRRSAALAMGGIGDPLALPPLMTAYELENEPLTKSFLLISIGKQGGETARAFLMKQLDKGDAAQRRWCALALGISARASVDPAIGDAIRTAAAKERSHDAQAAYWIAAGLAHDAASLPAIRGALFQATDPRLRMYAATALALIGGDESLAALRERRASDESPLVQVAIAQALGYAGQSADARGLIDTLAHLRDPELQSLAAVAMAFHGSSEALHGLSELSRLDGGSSVRRAAAIDGVGMLLGKRPPLELSEISRSSNFTVFGDFEEDLFQVTL